jgi:hypothetical protein
MLVWSLRGDTLVFLLLAVSLNDFYGVVFSVTALLHVTADLLVKRSSLHTSRPSFMTKS